MSEFCPTCGLDRHQVAQIVSAYDRLAAELAEAKAEIERLRDFIQKLSDVAEARFDVLYNVYDEVLVRSCKSILSSVSTP